jgi:L-lysine 6-transaminase
MAAIGAPDVHASLGQHLLVDGFDLVFDLKQSRGCYLVDSKSGRRFFDFFSFFATNPVGINHPRLTEPRFKAKLAEVALHNPSNSDVYTTEMAEFVETFSRLAMPPELPHLFLVAGGAVAVENALKAAFDWKVRKNFARGYREERGHQILHFEQAFHGRTGYALSLTNTADHRKTDYFPKFRWPRIVNPKLSFPLTAERQEEVAERERQAIRQIEAALTENRDDVAALIIEPIQGEGGDNHFRGEFLQKLRALADENEFLLIFDEIQTGVGLTGKMWAHQHFEVLPDLLCFGKKTQVCGVMAGRRIDEVAENVFTVPARINSTWGGNLVDMVRAARYFEIIEEEQLVANAERVGEHLLARIAELEAEFPRLVTNARGRGLMCAFDLPDGELRDRFRQEAYRQGLLILASGARAIRFRPSLTLSREDCNAGISLVRRSLEALAA